MTPTKLRTSVMSGRACVIDIQSLEHIWAVCTADDVRNDRRRDLGAPHENNLSAETQQQRFKLIKCLLLIGPDRLEDDTVAASQIGTEHFESAGGREILLAFANCDYALEPDHAPDKVRRRSRVQPQLVDNFDFFAHAVQSGGSPKLVALPIQGEALSRREDELHELPGGNLPNNPSSNDSVVR